MNTNQPTALLTSRQKKPFQTGLLRRLTLACLVAAGIGGTAGAAWTPTTPLWAGGWYQDSNENTDLKGWMNDWTTNTINVKTTKNSGYNSSTFDMAGQGGIVLATDTGTNTANAGLTYFRMTGSPTSTSYDPNKYIFAPIKILTASGTPVSISQIGFGQVNGSTSTQASTAKVAIGIYDPTGVICSTPGTACVKILSNGLSTYGTATINSSNAELAALLPNVAYQIRVYPYNAGANTVVELDNLALYTKTGAESISLTKTPDTLTYKSVGDVVTYTYVVKNTGDEPLIGATYNGVTGVVVTDDKIPTVTCTPPASGILDAGASMSCTGTYTITLTDLKAGKVVNNAVATAFDQNSYKSTANANATVTGPTSLLDKAWVNGKTGDAVALSISGTSTGNNVNGSSTVGGSTNTLATAKGGGTVTLTETFTSGSVANYTPTVICTNLTGGGTVTTTTVIIDTVNNKATSTYSQPASGVTSCVFTNTRKSATLQVGKSWTNSKTGDKATIPATINDGISSNTLSFTATAPTAANSGTAVTVYAGDTITFPAETTMSPGSLGNYTTTLGCTNNTNALSGTNGQASTGNTLLISSSDATKAIVCTYKNSRIPITLKVAKTWGLSSTAGDVTTVSTTGLTATASSGSSTATAAGNTTIGTGVTVYAGDTGTLTESSFANKGNYAQSYSCDTVGVIDTTGNITIPSTPATITCTLTNNVIPVSFGSCPAQAFIGRGTSSTTIGLYALDLGTGMMPQQGTNVLPTDTNGLGFRQNDGLIYGWGNGLSTPRLVQIGQNGASTTPFATAPSTLPSGATFYIADVQPSTGYYVGDYAGVLYFIDVTTNTLVKTVSLSPTSALDNSTDMAFNPVDGFIYSINKSSGQLIRINPDTGAVTTIDIAKQNADGTVDASTKLPLNDPAHGGFGAIFFDSKGTMYIYKSGYDSVSKTYDAYGAVFTIFNPSSTTPSWVRGKDSLTASNLDGARCPMAPPPYAPLNVTKKVTGATSTSAMTFNFTVTCTAPAGSYTGSVTVAANSAAASIDVSNIPLNSAGCKIAEDTSALPTAPTGYIWGTPSYSQPTDFIKVTGSTGTITNPLSPVATPGALTISKAATPYIKVNDPVTNTATTALAAAALTPSTISYTITVSNTGGSALSAVNVADTLPSGLTYVANSAQVAYSTVANTYGTPSTLSNTGSNTDLKFTLPTLSATEPGKTAQITFSATPAIAGNTNAVAYSNTATTSATGVSSQTSSAAVTNVVYSKLHKTVQNITKGTAASDTAADGLPGNVLEYCLPYNNYSSVALPTYSITDQVPGNTAVRPNAYGAGLGIKLTRVTATSTSTNLTSDGTDSDGGSLTTSGGTYSQGVVVVNLGSVAAGESGQVCFQVAIR